MASVSSAFANLKIINDIERALENETLEIETLERLIGILQEKKCNRYRHRGHSKETT
jgi:hypothetical protein